MSSQQHRNDDIISLVDHAYRIGPISTIASIHHGDWNQIYKIQADDIWVLRLSHARKQEKQLRFELEVMTHLRSQLPVIPAIHKTRQGQLYHSSNKRLIALFEFIPGDPIEKNENSIRSAATLLGRIHGILADYSRHNRLVNNLSTLDFNWADNYMFSGDILQTVEAVTLSSVQDQSLLKGIKTDLSYLRDVQERLNQWQKKQGRSGRFTASIIHGDYYYRNILTKDGHITGVLDWDETVTDWLEYEVANALFDFSRNDTHFDLDQAKKQAFLNAYQSQNNQIILDEEVLRHMIGFRRLIEINLDLYECIRQGAYDLAYCRHNINYLKLVMP